MDKLRNTFVSAALKGSPAIYLLGYQLAKAGVMLLKPQPCAELQSELDLQADDLLDRRRLMTTLDELNQLYGWGCAATGEAMYEAGAAHAGLQDVLGGRSGVRA